MGFGVLNGDVVGGFVLTCVGCGFYANLCVDGG